MAGADEPMGGAGWPDHDGGHGDAVGRAVGDRVAAGEALLVIETDKADVEIEAPASGTVAEIVGRVSEVCPIGEVLAVIDMPAGG